jgi:two-component system OmpR family response regulator
LRVLLIEDDRMLAEALRQALQDASHAVDWVRDGEAGLTAAATHDYGAVLLDLGLPKKSGFEVLRQIRSDRNPIPVLIVSGRDAVEERVAGLDLGADDYILKPFEVDELLARLRAVVRRKAGTANPVLSNGIVSLNPATREAAVGNRTVTLSAREFSLLQALLLQPGIILSRRALEERIYGWNEEVESNAVEYLIHTVRRKLGAGTIKNFRGLGWTVPKAGC